MRRSSIIILTLTALLLTAPTPLASPKTVTFVETLEDLSRDGGWSFGSISAGFVATQGGNPGAYYRDQGLFGPAAEAHTIEGFRRTIYHGDYRSRAVSLLGIDLALFETDGPTQRRPLSLILTSNDCKIFNVGGPPTPRANGKWRSYRFRIASTRETMPSGWAILDCPGRSEDQAWNEVIQDVLEVRFFTGDPTRSYAPQRWDIGMDNMSLTQQRNPLPTGR